MIGRTLTRLALGATLLASALARPLEAKPIVALLKSGGQVEGEWLNPERSGDQAYVVETRAGVRLTIDAARVQKVVREQPFKAEYEKLRPTFADTPEGQWELAEWCRKHHLSDQRRDHLERVIELDKDHAPARYALGYGKFGGQWKSQKEELLSRGYVEDPKSGKMVLPQVLEERERRAEIDTAERDWKQKISRWRDQLAGSHRGRAFDAERSIASVTDPNAVPALRDQLKDERLEPVRKLYIDTLAQIDSPAAVRVLADLSLYDENPELRMTCVDHLAKNPQPALVEYLIGKLHAKENPIINRAAVGLSHLNDQRAVRPLIDVLLTEHKDVVSSNPNNQTAASFSPDGTLGGFSAGNSRRVVKYWLKNPEVLDALISLTGGTNFEYNQPAWKHWYTQVHKMDQIDLRRDGAAGGQARPEPAVEPAPAP